MYVQIAGESVEDSRGAEESDDVLCQYELSVQGYQIKVTILKIYK